MTTVRIVGQGGFLGPFDIMFDEFGESYANSIERDVQARKTAQQQHERWGKGQIEPINLNLEVVAGVTDGVQNAARIQQIAQNAMGLSVQRPASAPSGTLTVVLLAIGNWYKRRVLIQRCEVLFGRPYDSQGRPMKLKIQMQLLPTSDYTPSRGSYKFK